ncbi:hypothetical protein GCM10027426_22080 [Microbacterium lacusdiani]
MASNTAAPPATPTGPGAWDGQDFTPDADEPRWLDGGAAFYAAARGPTSSTRWSGGT